MSDKTYYLYRDGQMEDVVADPTKAKEIILNTSGRDVEIRDEDNQRLAWKEVQESKGFVSSFAVADHSESATVGMTPEFRSLAGEDEPAKKKPTQQLQDGIQELVEREATPGQDRAPTPAVPESAPQIEAVEPRNDKPAAYYLWKEHGQEKEMVNVAETASDAMMMLNQEHHDFKDEKIYLADERGNKLAWREWQQETYGVLDQKRDVSRIVFSDEMLHDVAAEIYPALDQVRSQVLADRGQQATLDKEQPSNNVLLQDDQGQAQQPHSESRFAKQETLEAAPVSDFDVWLRQADAVRALNQQTPSLDNAEPSQSRGLSIG